MPAVKVAASSSRVVKRLNGDFVKRRLRGGSFNKYDWRNLATACENYKSQQFESICNLFNLVPIKSHRFSLSLELLCFAHIQSHICAFGEF